jgi:hypothetical protein
VPSAAQNWPHSGQGSGDSTKDKSRSTPQPGSAAGFGFENSARLAAARAMGHRFRSAAGSHHIPATKHPGKRGARIHRTSIRQRRTANATSDIAGPIPLRQRADAHRHRHTQRRGTRQSRPRADPITAAQIDAKSARRMAAPTNRRSLLKLVQLTK